MEMCCLGSQMSRWSTWVGITLLMAIVVASLSLLTGGLKELIRELKSVNPTRLAAALSFIILGEAVRAARLKYIARASGYSLSLIGALMARLAGRFASTITPGGVAGTPTRAAIIGTAGNMELGKALGLSLIETFADTVIPATILVVFMALGLGSWIVVGFSAFVLAMWIGGTIAAVSSRTVSAIYHRLHVSESIRCIIERQRELLIEALKMIPRPSFLVVVSIITVIAHLIEALGIMFLIHSTGFDPILFIRGFAAVESSYIMVSAPTPGGSGAIEYGFYVFLGSSLAVYWRLAHLLASLIPGAILALIAPKIRVYLKGNAWGGGSCA